MKKVLLSGALALGLLGCTSMTTMTPTQFNQLTPTQIPFSGYWSGTTGTAISTLKLDRQGRGQLCMDNRQDLMSYKVKLLDNELYTDQGIKFKVKELTSQTAVMQMSLLGVGATFNMGKDDQLKQASARCQQVLNR
ncbi:J517_1871 family lipoprotein [Acinetobacter corruptisaponis]